MYWEHRATGTQPSTRTWLRLQLKITRRAWHVAQRVADEAKASQRALSIQRREEAAVVATQSEVLRRAQASLHELTVEQETWRHQSAQQADVIAAAISAAASKHAEHEEEVALLSEKLRQLLDERQGLQAVVDSQAADLKLMSTEMMRVLG